MDGILPLSSVLSMVSTARHREKLNGRYLSSAAEYGPPFLQRIRELTQGSPFWSGR